jgi:ATP-dependent DNA helicase RecQ
MVSGDRVAVRCSDDETRTFIARYVKRAATPEKINALGTEAEHCFAEPARR